MRPSSVFNAARIRSLDSKLLTNEKVHKLLAADSAEEVFSMLADYGLYSGEGIDKDNYEAVIKKDFHDTCRFLREEISNAGTAELFFCGYDYHNAKVFFKSESSKSGSGEDAVIDEGLIEYKKLKEYLSSKNYDFLPRPMREALRQLEKDSSDIAVNIGTAMDAAYSCDVEERLKDISDEFAQKYFRVLFDYSNMIMFIRMKRAGVRKRSFEDCLMKSSLLNTMLVQFYDKEEKDLPSLFPKTDYADGFAEGYSYLNENGSFAMFQKKRDDAIMSLITEYSKDIGSDAPMIGYLTAKQREINAVRTVIIAKLYGIPEEKIAEILPVQMH